MAAPGALVGWPNWVGVVCRDLEKQRAFYREALGFSELGHGEDWAWFDLGWPNVFELLALDEAAPQYDQPRFQSGFSVGDIRAARDELLRRGVEPVGEIAGEPGSAGYWCYFRDREGHIFEISQRLGPPWPSGASSGSTRQIVGWPVWMGVVAEDVDAERTFYRDVLGIPEMRSGEGWVEFDMGWPNLLEVERFSKPYERPGYHVSFGVGDIDRAGDELGRRGVEAVTEAQGSKESGGMWRYFRDGEGNLFSISQRFGPPWPT